MGAATDTEALQQLDDLHARARRAVNAAREARGDGPGAGSMNDLIDRLDEAVDEVDGLHTAMRTRAIIEQAKGVLMWLFRCSEDEAFNHLVRMSQESQTKVHDVAARLLARIKAAEGPLPDGRQADDA